MKYTVHTVSSNPPCSFLMRILSAPQTRTHLLHPAWEEVVSMSQGTIWVRLVCLAATWHGHAGYLKRHARVVTPARAKCAGKAGDNKWAPLHGMRAAGGTNSACACFCHVHMESRVLAHKGLHGCVGHAHVGLGAWLFKHTVTSTNSMHARGWTYPARSGNWVDESASPPSQHVPSHTSP